MIDFDFKALKVEIVAASIQAINELTTQYNKEEFCSFSIYTDSGAMTVCSTMNTLSELKRVQAEEDPDEQAYFKFSPQEWPPRYEKGAEKSFNALCEKTYNAVMEDEEDDDEAWFKWFQENLTETCLSALEELRSDFLADRGDNFLLMFVVSDDDLPAKIQCAQVARLNSPVVAAEFKAWTKTWD